MSCLECGKKTSLLCSRCKNHFCQFHLFFTPDEEAICNSCSGGIYKACTRCQMLTDLSCAKCGQSYCSKHLFVDTDVPACSKCLEKSSNFIMKIWCYLSIIALLLFIIILTFLYTFNLQN